MQSVRTIFQQPVIALPSAVAGETHFIHTEGEVGNAPIGTWLIIASKKHLCQFRHKKQLLLVFLVRGVRLWFANDEIMGKSLIKDASTH